VASTLVGLNARRKPKWQPVFPDGTRQKYSKAIAQRFCDLLSSTHLSLMDLLREHPELPPWDQLASWRASKPDFEEAWRKAREAQANHLVQLSLSLAADTNPKNAHAQRVRFDIYKWVASKFHPTMYGDKPPTTAVNVAVGFNVSASRLEEIRSKLDVTRNTLTDTKTLKNGNRIPDSNQETCPNGVSDSVPLLEESRTDGNRHD
jgi:hypothetical protein